MNAGSAFLLAACCLAGGALLRAQPGRAPVPDAEALRAAEGRVLDAMADVLVELGVAGGRAAEALARRADASEDPATRYLLLQQAMRCAVKNGAFAAGLEIARRIASAFEVDAFEVRLHALDAFAGHASVPAHPLAREYLALARSALEESATDRVRLASERARRIAERGPDPAVAAWVREELGDLKLMRRAWLRVAQESPESPARGWYLCLYRGEWERGLALLSQHPEARVRALAEVKSGSALDGRACLRVAESWLSRLGEARDDLARRRLRERALSWYRRAWPSLEGLERDRVVRQMALLEDALAARPGPGRIRFARPADVDQLEITGGEWRVEDGRLLGSSASGPTLATYGHAYRRIDSVTIRGGIASADNLNFRFAVGPLNVLLNWEVHPENHFYLGDRRSVTSPRALAPGAEHTLRVRQLGGDIVVFADDRELFRGAGELAGTVTVYPAIGSEIFVRELVIDGELDPVAAVDRPSGATR